VCSDWLQQTVRKIEGKKHGMAAEPTLPIKYSRTPLSRMAKIQGICPGQRIIRDSELGFGVKKFRIQGISSGTAGDPGE